jgi:hypothetical protein
VYIGLSITPPSLRTEDSRPVLRTDWHDNRSVHFPVTRCAENLPLPHRILQIGDGRDSFLKIPSSYSRISTHHGVACECIRLLESTALQKTHRTRFIKVSKACRFYKPLLGLYKMETIHCKTWSDVYGTYCIHCEVNMTSLANTGTTKASSIYKYFQSDSAIAPDTRKWRLYGRAISEITSSF